MGHVSLETSAIKRLGWVDGRAHQGVSCHGDDALNSENVAGGASGNKHRVPSTTAFSPVAAAAAPAPVVATSAAGAGSALGRLALAEVKVRCGVVWNDVVMSGAVRYDAVAVAVAIVIAAAGENVSVSDRFFCAFRAGLRRTLPLLHAYPLARFVFSSSRPRGV